MATVMPYDTEEPCIMVHINRHYPNFPDPGNVLGYFMGGGL